MPNSWVTALKKWNDLQNNNKHCIPKKGTPEYSEVRAIMNGNKLETAKKPEAIRRSSRVRKKTEKAQVTPPKKTRKELFTMLREMGDQMEKEKDVKKARMLQQKAEIIRQALKNTPR